MSYGSGDASYLGLNGFVLPLLDLLDLFQPAGQNFANMFDNHNQTYFNDSDSLVNKNAFWGYGAQAFLTSVVKQISDSEVLVRGLRHISSGTSSYRQSVDSITSQYASKVLHMWTDDTGNGGNLRDALVECILQNVTLNELLTNGSTAIAGASAKGKSALLAMVPQLVSSTFDSQQQGPNPQTKESQIATMRETALGICSQVEPVLEAWADELCHATRQYRSIIFTADDYMTVGDMFQDIFHDNNVDQSPMLQNTNKPIEIIPYKMPDGSTRLLVIIAGTDALHPFYADNFARAAEFGYSPKSDAPYLKDVEHAIQSYLGEHPEITDPHITMMGYSLGGMVAQNLTGKAANYSASFDNVITVGSPIMGPPTDFSATSSVDYKLYMGKGDLIPLLSNYEMSYSNISGNKLHRISTAYQMNWNDRVQQYIDPSGQYGNSISQVPDLPYKKQSIASELIHGLPDHRDYNQSNFLENQKVKQFTKASQMGVPEYFPVTNFH